VLRDESRLPADMMMEDTLDKARQLRDEMVARSVQSSTARHIYKIYPEADSEALPEAMESLLGACSGALRAATHAWGLHRLKGTMRSPSMHAEAP